MWRLLIVGSCCLSCCLAAPEVELASGGQAKLSIVTAPAADPAVKTVAGELAEMLGRISGAAFQVAEGDGTTGIAVGTGADFPRLALADLVVREPGDRDHYLLRSHPGGLLLVGTTPTAVDHAVWDLLHRLGYRQFFPGPVWEVVPRSPGLRLAVEADERPAYVTRRIWYGYGAWPENREPYQQWCRRNRTDSGFQLNTGHAYDAIIRANREAFAAHPEYLGLLGGERKSSKLCVGNPELRQLVVGYALRWFAENPAADTISMEPSDGGGWCECERCVALGSPTNRAVTMANQVAEAVVAKLGPERSVGLYAYAYHSPPPTIRVHPNVIVSVATAFLQQGWTTERLLDAWRAQGVQRFGIREYYNVNTWSRDLPGSGRGADLSLLAGSIPDFHQRGARFMSAESSDSWGPNGLGYYFAARCLWDTAEAARSEAVVDDFLTRCFGGAKPPMTAFYRLLDQPTALPLSEHLVGRMYRLIDEARRLESDPAVRARLDHLTLYTRYVELYRACSDAAGEARQAAFEALIRHAWRMRTTMMVHSLALYRDLDSRDKQVAIPAEAAWNVPEGKNPWKRSDPWTADELTALVAGGIEHNRCVEYQPGTWSEDLVPAGLSQDPPAGATVTTRRSARFYTRVTEAPATIEVKVTGGLIAHYRDRGNVRLTLHRLPEETLVAHDESTPPDGEERMVKLAVDRPGLYRLEVNDGGDMTRLAWPAGYPLTWRSDLTSAPLLAGRAAGCFYLPPGTTRLVAYCPEGDRSGRARLLDADGKPVYELRERCFFEVPVPASQQGRLWTFENAPASLRLLTTPPYLAPSPAMLLVPREAKQP